MTRMDVRTKISVAFVLAAAGPIVAGVRLDGTAHAQVPARKLSATSHTLPENVQDPELRVIQGEGHVMPPPVAAGPSREEIVNLIRAVGRDPVTPELVDQVAFWFRPQVLWARDFTRTRHLMIAPDFVRRVDAIAKDVNGKPANTLTLLRLTTRYHVGYDDAALAHFLLEDSTTRSRFVSLEGTVRDAYTGRPVAGARVFSDKDFVRTDEAGRFTLRTERPHESRPYGVLVKYWIEADGFALREAVAQPAIPREWAIHLLREVSFGGQVLDEKRQPVQGAEVQAAVGRTAVTLDGSDRLTQGSNVVSLQVRTDELGRFSVRGVPPSESPVHLTILHPEYQTARLSRVAPTTPETPLVVRLAPGCLVEGIVVDELGNPVAEASVEIRKPSGLGREHSRHTDDHGRFQFGNVSPGSWDLLVQPERQAPTQIQIHADLARPSNSRVVVTAGSYIEGKVVGPHGEPIGHAAVGWAESLGGEIRNLGRMTNAAADGTFRLGPLPPGEFRIAGLTESPRRLGKVVASANQTDAVIRLEPAPIARDPR